MALPMSQAATFDEAARQLRAAERVVVFTGAGVSAASGIETFRDPGGLWSRYPPERFATVSGLLRTATFDPRQIVRFARDVLAPIADAEPNPAHQAIAEIERRAHATVVTQNIDGLHRDAGSHGVRQVHGSMLEVTSSDGHVLRRLSRLELRAIAAQLGRAASGRLALWRGLRAVRPLLGLSRTGPYRPNVVLFGEALRQPDWDDAQRGAEQCDLMLVVGTSGMVVPAAELPLRAAMRGATVILVDPDADLPADIHLRGRAADLMPQLVQRAYG